MFLIPKLCILKVYIPERPRPLSQNSFLGALAAGSCEVGIPEQYMGNRFFNSICCGPIPSMVHMGLILEDVHIAQGLNSTVKGLISQGSPCHANTGQLC